MRDLDKRKEKSMSKVPTVTSTTTQSPWFIAVVAIFVTCLLVANVIAVKLIYVFGQVLPAAVVIFPVSYIFGDVLTEVYGHKVARRVIWLGFFCDFVAVVAIWLAQILPAASF